MAALPTTSRLAIKSDGAPFTHGAYSQLYRKDLAAYEALKSYRTFNLSAPIHLVSDGGDDLSVLGEMFHCHYVHEPVNNGTYVRRHAQTNQYVWLKRLYDGCTTTLAEVDWVLLLESDVECFKSPTHFPRYAISEGPFGSPWNPALREFFARRWGNLVHRDGLGCNYRGCGGSIFNRRAFIESFASTEYSRYEEGCRLDHRVLIAEDAALSFMLHLNGHDTGPWEDMARWDNPNKHLCAVAHGEKRHHGKPFPSNLFPPGSPLSNSISP